MVTISNFREDQYPIVSGTRCIKIYIPDDDAFKSLLGGLLALAGVQTNYQNDDEAKAASLAQQWIDAYVQSDWTGCGEANMWAIGMGLPWFGGTPPASWLKCDGSLISRATYADLFAVIGEIYGAGDGSTTFQLPDGRGTTMVGSGQAFSGGTTWPIGTLSGSERVTLSAAEMPTHTHALTYGGFLIDTGNAGPMVTGAGLGLTGGPTPTGSAGSNSAHNNMQPSQIIDSWIIYAGV